MPGIATTRASIPLGGNGSDWASSWAHSGLFLFFASDPTDILNKVSATRLPNQVTGSSDFLTVTGTGLNARYWTPDNETYRTADSDYVFWKTDASESTCDGNRLIGYDFPRILVKCLNVAPYTILAIAILKPGVTVTDGMRDAFDLSIWWDNTLSFHGNWKDNRGTGQSIWTPETTFTRSAEYDAVYQAMVNKPLLADQIIQDTMLKALVDGGYYAKADFLDIYAVHNGAEGLWNWKNPATFNPELINNPAFVAYEGYKGNSVGGKCLNTKYNPFANKINVTPNSLCMIMGIGDDVNEAIYDAGCFNGAANYTMMASRNANNAYFHNTDAGGAAATANLNSKKHYAMSRGGAAGFDSYINLVKTAKTATSLQLPNKEIYACGWNNNNTPAPNNKTLRYLFMFSYLTEAEVQAVIGIMETYLDNYGTGLY